LALKAAGRFQPEQSAAITFSLQKLECGKGALAALLSSPSQKRCYLNLANPRFGGGFFLSIVSRANDQHSKSLRHSQESDVKEQSKSDKLDSPTLARLLTEVLGGLLQQPRDAHHMNNSDLADSVATSHGLSKADGRVIDPLMTRYPPPRFRSILVAVGNHHRLP
jgi:hypothetical protein